MASELCTEDIVVRFSTPQSITTSGAGANASGASGGGGGGGVVELGRRLLSAARDGDTEAVRDLMVMGAAFTTDWLGASALHLAAANGHADTCGVLLRAGISRDARTKVERTPLHLAAHAGREAAARALLEAGAAPDCRDMLRMTPLHWAAQRGHAAVARLLLAAGADPRARSKFLKTPTDIARDRDDRALLQLLRRAEAERAAADAAGGGAAEPEEERERPAAQEPGGGGGGGGGAGPATAAAALLRAHGITLLPADDGSTVLSALQSGRTVVLSDAGKLMLKESEGPRSPMKRESPDVATVAEKRTFELATLGDASASAPETLTFHKSNSTDDVQVKYVRLPADAKIVSQAKPAHARRGAGEPHARRAAPGAAAKRAAPAAAPAAVKIFVNRGHIGKLIAGAAPAPRRPAAPDNVVRVPEEFLKSRDPEFLRVQLLAAHAAISALKHQLKLANARLAAR